jgi:tungstate transport system ATP-binding protein
MTPPVIEIADALICYGGRTALDIPDFAVTAGKIVAIVGPNGAGKTTLLHVAALLRNPDQGSVTILGQTATAENAAHLRRSLSVVFQHPLLFDVSVLANAAAGLRFRGQSRREAEPPAQLWLERFGIGQLATRRARGLSGGEAARVALARAFATDPAILLLDEPFSALDAPTRSELLPMLRSRLREAGAAAILVTHDLGEAFAFADRVDLMDDGRIIASGEGPTLVAKPPSRRAAGLLGVESIHAARVICVENGKAIVAIDPAGPQVGSRLCPGATPCPGQIVTVTLPASAAQALRPSEPPPAGWNLAPGRVTAVTTRPSATTVTVATPALLVATARWDPSGRRWSAGDPAIVAFPPEALHLIPDAS